MKILMLAMAAMAWAQDAQPKMEHKLIQLKYADANAIRNILGALPGNIQADDRLHALVVNGSPDVVAVVESAIAKLDRLQVSVGYPDTFRTYDGLDIRADDLFGNVQRAKLFEYRYHPRLASPYSFGNKLGCQHGLARSGRAGDNH